MSIQHKDLIEAAIVAARLRTEVATLCTERWAQDPDSQVGGFDQKEADLNMAAGLLEALSSEITHLWDRIVVIREAIPEIPR
jgi:hypothetical protein